MKVPGRSRLKVSVGTAEGKGETELAYSVCCIYHKPKKFDESSSESSSDSDSESDSSCRHGHSHRHEPRGERPQRPSGAADGEGSTRTREGATVIHELHDPADEVNRYERVTKRKGKQPVNRGDCESLFVSNSGFLP